MILHEASPVLPTEPLRAEICPAKHLPALDGIRGLAILLVLFFHFPAPFAWLQPLSTIGWCGVDLFFVLSGYLITGILLSTAGHPHYFRNFYVRRCLRIFPLYYGFLLLTLLVLPRFINPFWLGLETLTGNGVPFFLYYSNYANVFVGWVPVSLAAFWSLAVEEHFYLVWPLLVKVTPKTKLLALCAVITLFALLSRLTITGFKGTWLAAYFLTTSRVDSLAIGAMTAIAAKRHPAWLERWMPPIATYTFLTLSLLALWRRGLFFNDWPTRTFGYSLLAVLFASIVWLASGTGGRASRLFSHAILVTFGKYSYCLYIVHMLVLTVCERWLGPRLFPLLGLGPSDPTLMFLCCMTISFAIALVSWRFYESPFLRLKERFTV